MTNLLLKSSLFNIFSFQPSLIEGKVTSPSYENKEGEKRYITEIICNELVMLGK